MVVCRRILALASFAAFGLLSSAEAAGRGDPAVAQSGPAMPKAAVETLEMVAPAATLVSKVHYQAQITMTCLSSGSSCSGAFPAPGSKRRINVTQISCIAFSSSAFQFATLAIINTSGQFVIQEFMPNFFSS